MAIILNIETSTEVCSVNLAKNEALLAERESLEGLNHSRLLTVFIEALFDEAGLNPDGIDAVAVSMGPGSYTGLRIGTSVAKGICYALDKPLIGVPTLDAFGKYASLNADDYISEKDGSDSLLFCPMIDARRMEVYTALYDAEGKQVEPVSARVIDEEAFSSWLSDHKILFFGNGAAKCQKAITHPSALFQGPQKASARFMLTIAEEKFRNKEFENVAYFEPFYLKDFIATVPGNKVL